jgi:DNA-damage-inducible protein D
MVWLEGLVRIEYDSYVRGLEEKKLLTEKGVEYWMARDLMPLLAYEKWDNFEKTIDKARSACAAAQFEPDHHFLETGNMVQIGSGAQRERGDWFLSRYACYLIAMNADATKSEVGYAMTYFAGQTRRQELHDQIAEQERRLAVRLRLMENNHRLAGAAKNAGVIRYPIFQDAGHRGLYEMSLAEVKAHKGLLPSQELLDNVGRLELSAPDFRATLTEERLNRDEVKTEQRAIETHRAVGREVRQVMMRDNGVRPENLPTEPSITRLVRKQRKRIKDAKAR